MAWIQSLMRLADLEIETLQKRLAEISDRRVAMEMILASLDQELFQETARARLDAEAAWYMVGFREGVKIRKAKALAQLNVCKLEEQGAREALTVAFEGQKKYENIAETARVAELKEEARRENAALDEIAMRMTGTR